MLGTQKTIEEMEADLNKAREDKAQQEKFQAAVSSAAAEKMTATKAAMLAIEEERHSKAKADINEWFAPVAEVAVRAVPPSFQQ